MANATGLFAVQTKVYEVLSAASALTDLAPVFDAVPEGQAFPYIEIGELEETPDNTFGKSGRALLVTLHVYSDQAGFREVELIVEQLNVLLDATLLGDPVGWKCWSNDYELGSLDKEVVDGVETRHATVRYLVKVSQP